MLTPRKTPPAMTLSPKNQHGGNRTKNRLAKPRVFILLQHTKQTVRLRSAEFLCLLFLFFCVPHFLKPRDDVCVMALEPPETGRCDATARARDVTNRIDTFPGPATVAEFLCFYFFFSPLFHLSIQNQSWIGTGLEFPLLSPDEEDGTLPRKERDRDTLRASRTTWSSVIESVQYYPRKTRVFIFPVPKPTAVNGPAVPRRKPSFYVFVLLSFSDTLSSSTPTRTNECTVRAHTHTIGGRTEIRARDSLFPEQDA